MSGGAGESLVGDALAAINGGDWERVKDLLHPYLHWVEHGEALRADCGALRLHGRHRAAGRGEPRRQTAEMVRERVAARSRLPLSGAPSDEAGTVSRREHRG